MVTDLQNPYYILLGSGIGNGKWQKWMLQPDETCDGVVWWLRTKMSRKLDHSRGLTEIRYRNSTAQTISLLLRTLNDNNVWLQTKTVDAQELG